MPSSLRDAWRALRSDCGTTIFAFVIPAAAWLPARRASGVAPLTALRAE